MVNEESSREKEDTKKKMITTANNGTDIRITRLIVIIRRITI